MLKFFKVMGKALSGELSCMWTGLVGEAGQSFHFFLPSQYSAPDKKG